ncbi:NUDIX hydrolase [Nitrospina gracilis 3/211]|uniref:NUDIX hydrolase n=1 Tax=Nitrospina gracilis (strain 3/211) TaxID=1266370 RepID=M1YKE0_NITG3|nr:MULTISPECIES: NUDIX hydrolase [Nitrospina]MCF8723834.1 ADP-ribose pyrophosphatase YjhB (NUDIX family) [Nitrospina sp. Nb-3]CCQ90952.1 NUDIX hydrolase [Nitrospina gracilis 3/211]
MSYKKPAVAVDLIIEVENRGIVLIERKNPPHGWALPGGFVDYGESLESAAIREAREEIQLDVRLLGQFHSYSRPDRDPRVHCISTVFLARAEGEPKAADDARNCALFPHDRLPEELAFDHAEILRDYLSNRWGTSHPAGSEPS